eukprot:2351306-Alexandrium_andersonii.AAC.1
MLLLPLSSIYSHRRYCLMGWCSRIATPKRAEGRVVARTAHGDFLPMGIAHVAIWTLPLTLKPIVAVVPGLVVRGAVVVVGGLALALLRGPVLLLLLL